MDFKSKGKSAQRNPIVDEVRAIRAKLFRQSGCDTEQFGRMLMQRQSKAKRGRRNPKAIRKTAAPSSK